MKVKKQLSHGKIERKKRVTRKDREKCKGEKATATRKDREKR